MLDGIEQPGDRRLLQDIAQTPQVNADLWRDGFDVGREAGLASGYIDAMMEAARLLIELGAGIGDAKLQSAYTHVAEVLLDKAKGVISRKVGKPSAEPATGPSGPDGIDGAD